MKKHVKTLIIALSICATGFFCAAGAAGIVKYNKKIETEKLQSACVLAYDILCIQAYACGVLDSAKECHAIAEEAKVCDVTLPELKVINSCMQDLRDIKCADSLPPSCQTFME
jgi:hypothetical protein